MDICNCHIDFDAFLCDIPREWREGIVKALCYTLNVQPLDCQGVRNCQTLTSLSPFTLNGSELSITYINEKGTIKTSTLDLSPAIEASLDDIDPSCLMSQGAWDALSHAERIQAIIDGHCNCCPTTTTTSTTTTTTTCYDYYLASRYICIGETGICGQVASGVLVAVPCGFTNIPGTYYPDSEAPDELYLITSSALSGPNPVILDILSGQLSCNATCPTTTTTTTTTTSTTTSTSTTTTTTCCEITDANIELSTTSTTTTTTTP